MKKILAFLVLAFFLISFVSASVEFSKEPNEIYNLEDYVKATLKFEKDEGVASVVSVNLICGDKVNELYKEFLLFDEEKTKQIVAPLITQLIDGAIGNCYLGVNFDGEEKLTSEVFKISKLLKIKLDIEEDEYLPGDSYLFSGNVKKENGAPSNGFLEGNFDNKKISAVVKDGKFSFDLNFDDDFKSGEHHFNLTAYEKDSQDVITNEGRNLETIKVKQIPKSVEILLEKDKLIPGEVLKGKVILHDQSGTSMKAKAYLKLEDYLGSVLVKVEVDTEEDFEYQTNITQLPILWTLAVYSEELINRVDVEVISYPHVSIDFVNETLVVTNTGNVFFNDSIEVQIGETAVKVPISLGMGESEQYVLTAPNGEYVVVVDGVERTMSLTGNAVSVEKLGDVVFQIHPLIWLFIILVFAFVAYLAFRKGRPKEFITKMIPRRKPKQEKIVQAETLAQTKKKLELSLSIVGTKQNAVVGCIALKNYDLIKNGLGNVKETMKVVSDLVESKKGLIYRNNGNIFFIFAPSVTKTFKNQNEGLDTVIKIKEILLDHNKKFKQRIEFGLSINFGTIVTKEEKDSVKFMSMGTLMTVCKKVANYSKEEVYVTDKFKEKLEGNFKGEMVDIGNVKAYKFLEMKNKDSHGTFIEGFLARQQKERMMENNKK